MYFVRVLATTEIYTLSLHDALPIFVAGFANLEFNVAHDEEITTGAYNTSLLN